MEVKKTKNYDMFSLPEWNREVKSAHVKNLVMSISESNLLESNYIIVNEKYEVVDGQHRLMAAQKMGVDIYYAVIPGAGLKEAQIINSNNKPWDIEQFLDSYCKQGIKDYLLLREFIDENDIQVTMGISLCMGGVGRRKESTSLFRNGKFRMTTLKEAIKLLEEVNRFKKFMIGKVHRHAGFISALDAVRKIDLLGELERKCEMQNVQIVRQTQRKNYLRQFEDILNYAVREENRIRLY